MKTSKTRFHIHLILAIIASLSLVLTAQAQTSTQNAEEKSGNDIEQLKTRLEQLRSLVEQQQRAMTEMQKRINELDDKTRAGAAVPASLKADPRPEARTASSESSQTQKSDPPSSPVARDKEKDKPVIVAGWDKNHAFLRSADGAF